MIAPYTAADAKGLLKAAIRDPNPVIFLENEILYGQSFPVPKLDDFVLPIGKAQDRARRQRRDHRLVVDRHDLRAQGRRGAGQGRASTPRSSTCARSGRWTSTPIVESVKKTGRLVTVEEGWPQSGVGAEIAARVMEQAFDYLDAPVARVTGKDVPMPYAANLEKLALPSVAEVIEAAKSRLLPVSFDPEKAAPVFDALHIPPAALEQGGVEVLRAVDRRRRPARLAAPRLRRSGGLGHADRRPRAPRRAASTPPKSQMSRGADARARSRAIFEAEMDAPSDPGTTSAIS